MGGVPVRHESVRGLLEVFFPGFVPFLPSAFSIRSQMRSLYDKAFDAAYPIVGIPFLLIVLYHAIMQVPVSVTRDFRLGGKATFSACGPATLQHRIFAT